MATEANTRHLPKGTLAELQAARIDPSTHGCCHRNGSIDGVTIMGCPVEKDCPFAQKRYGGFKGDGPEYVGYYHQTSRADEGKQHENIISCFGFVATLLRRMRKGIADKEDGRDYEHIELIALPQKVLDRAKANGDNSILNRFGNSVVVTKWKSEVPKSLVNMNLTPETAEIEVPAFPRPSENPGITHSQRLKLRAEARRLMRTQEDEGGDASESREQRLTRIKKELAEMSEPTLVTDPDIEASADDVIDMPAPSGQPVTARPVERKKP